MVVLHIKYSDCKDTVTKSWILRLVEYTIACFFLLHALFFPLTQFLRVTFFSFCLQVLNFSPCSFLLFIVIYFFHLCYIFLQYIGFFTNAVHASVMHSDDYKVEFYYWGNTPLNKLLLSTYVKFEKQIWVLSLVLGIWTWFYPDISVFKTMGPE